MGRYILSHLSSKPNKWDVHYQAWHYYGMPVKNATFEDGKRLNYWMHAGGQHVWGADMLQRYINELRPDIFWTLCDSFMLVQEGPGGRINNWITNINFAPTKSVLYFPSDGEPFPAGCDVALRKFDYKVAMSKFGQEQVKRQYNIDVDYIPHCVDTSLFYKMSNAKEALRAKWTNNCVDSYGRPFDIRNKRIVLCVARNQPRKFLDRMVKLAKEYFKNPDNSDVIFLMKSDMGDPASGGLSLPALAAQEGVADKIIWIRENWFVGFTIHEMREIYNLADCFALLTSGEGFGIPFIEAMSCELPILATDFTTPRELVDNDDRQLIKCPTSITGTFNVERGIADIPDGSKKLQALMDEEMLRISIGKANRAKVLREYSTTVVLPKWENYFQKVIYD